MKAVGINTRSAIWLGEKKLSRIMLILGGILLFVAVVGIFSYLLIQDVFTFGTFPPGVSVVGINVAGLTKTDAIAECQEKLSDVASRPLTLQVDDEKYQVSAQDIGLKLEYRKMVNTAYKDAWSVNIFERMARRFINRPKRINVSLMSQNNDQLVVDFVNRAIASINRAPNDAYVDVTSGSPVIVKAKDGRLADLNQLVADTREALGTPERTVNVKFQRTPAQFQDNNPVFQKFIIINLSDHTLTLYEREKPLVQFPVACGSSTFPTPVGHWKVYQKQKNPAWRNPGSAWAASMPPYIPPGPNNPLGTRALPLNAGGVLIHGTPSPWSVGQSVSHGCVRMYMKDVEALFEMVDAGIHVYVIKAVGNPGFDVTKTPAWVKADAGLTP